MQSSESFLEEIRCSSGGDHVIKEYNSLKSLHIEARQLLVKIVVDIMRRKCGTHPKADDKVLYAIEIINAFPGLKDPLSKGEGYVSNEDNLT